MKNFPLLCGAIMIIGSCTQRPKANEPAPAAFLPENIKTVDRLVGIFMNKYAVPGVSFTIARNDSIKIERCYGYADKDAGILMNPGNRFRIASVSKTITATAIMKLVEQGKLHLQDKVFGPAGILGTTYGTYPYKRWVAEITVADLLEHLGGGWSGWHKNKDPNADWDPVNLHPELDLDALLSNGGWVATPTDLVKFMMRVDKFPQKPDILEPATLDTMFSAPAVSPDYAKGWFVNKSGDYFHSGGFPGMQSVLVRTHDGFCWAVIINTYNHNVDNFGGKLDQLMWEIRRAINYWPDGEM